MTELTQDQQATLKRAQEREGKTTPAPWRYVRDFDKDINTGIISIPIKCDLITVGITKDGDACMNVHKIYDANALIDAPALQDLAIAQAHVIEEQARRIAALEAKRQTPDNPTYRIVLEMERKGAEQFRHMHRAVVMCGDVLVYRSGWYSWATDAADDAQVYINNIKAQNNDPT